MFDAARSIYADTLAEIRAAGLYKEERVITSPQGAAIRTTLPLGCAICQPSRMRSTVAHG